jgi:hypothetical protein
VGANTGREGRGHGHKTERGPFHRRYDHEHALIGDSIHDHQSGAMAYAQSSEQKPAYRVYRSDRADDYSWVHDDGHVRLTATLHKLFSSGYAMTSPENRNVAVLTEKGREMVAVRGSC